MKNFKRMISLCLCLMMIMTCIPAAFAAEVPDATIHMDAPCSLTIFKYDLTNAKKDGAWDENGFTSTGWGESYVQDSLGNVIRKGDKDGNPNQSLGNHQTSYGYALKGVEFTYLRVADIATFTESANDGHADYNMTQVVYGFDKVKSADLMKAIGLADGAGRYVNADNTDKLVSSNYYYTSDTLNKAMADSLKTNPTVVKNALEDYMAANGGTAMAMTDEYGKTTAQNLPVGLYLLVETKVPEMVTNTTNPFFVSLPMTTVSGNDHSASPEGGHEWNYNVTVYPKNETGIPTLEKTVREAQMDTGKNEATDVITDGFAHNATGSSGDIMEYQVISSLPTITSKATSLTTYSFYDTLCEGLTYTQPGDVKLEIFTDKACSNKVATWTDADGKFKTTFTEDGRHMTVEFTQMGLDEVNGNTENVNGHVYAGYSNYTVRITYTAKVNSDNSFVYGQDGNENTVVLTWKRTSGEYYDTLVDDAHVYSFGVDISKEFSDMDSQTAEEKGLYQHVKFKIYNKTDGYWVVAELNPAEGIYYVTGHAAEEAQAAVLSPVSVKGTPGQILVKGLEDDEYIITEVETANGYTLLKDDIHVVITAKDDPSRPCNIYAQDVYGVLQNDPQYAFAGGLDLSLSNIPQKQLAHNYLTASATVDGNAVQMLANNYEGDAVPKTLGLPTDGTPVSPNAVAPLTVVNTRGFDLPQTGDHGVWMYGVAGTILMAGALSVILLMKKKKTAQQ